MARSVADCAECSGTGEGPNPCGKCSHCGGEGIVVRVVPDDLFWGDMPSGVMLVESRNVTRAEPAR